MWFRPRADDDGAPKQWDNFDDFGFGGNRFRAFVFPFLFWPFALVFEHVFAFSSCSMLQGLRMMEANETADQFDELLSQLRIDEMNPVEVQESSDAAVDTENLPHCSSCGGPIVGQVNMTITFV